MQQLSAVSGEIQYSIEIEYSIPRIMEAQFGGLNWKAGVWDLDGLPGSVFITQSSWWSISYQDNRFSANRTINIHVFIEILSRLSTSFVLLCWFWKVDFNDSILNKRSLKNSKQFPGRCNSLYNLTSILYLPSIIFNETKNYFTSAVKLWFQVCESQEIALDYKLSRNFTWWGRHRYFKHSIFIWSSVESLGMFLLVSLGLETNSISQCLENYLIRPA